MLLADGRRLLDPRRAAEEAAEQAAAIEAGGGVGVVREVVPIHPDFRLWVLANRPGFPFLGQDFFAECGDIFATHVRRLSVRTCLPCVCGPVSVRLALRVALCGRVAVWSCVLEWYLTCGMCAGDRQPGCSVGAGTSTCLRPIAEPRHPGQPHWCIRRAAATERGWPHRVSVRAAPVCSPCPGVNH